MKRKYIKTFLLFLLVLLMIILLIGCCLNKNKTLVDKNSRDVVTNDDVNEKEGVNGEEAEDIPFDASDFNTSMKPSSTALAGFRGGYVFVPIGDSTYRYSSISREVSEVTKDKLLYECSEETATGEKYEWKFYSVKEYPGCETILSDGFDSLLWDYRPDTGKDENEITDVIKNGFVVFENGSVIYGKRIWNDFLTRVNEGKNAKVYLANTYRQNQSNVEEDTYLAESGDYPALFLNLLTYDGSTYTVDPIHKIDGEYVVFEEKGYDSPSETFEYMLHYYGPAEYDFCLFSYYDKYVLVNDDTASWKDIQDAVISSDLSAYIPYHEVYCEYTWK